MGRNEKPVTETALALIAAPITPAEVYGTEEGKGISSILDKITAKVRATVIDVSTKAGREAANSLAFNVARSKTLLDDMGKDLVADWKSKSAKVDAERKIIRDRLDTLKAEVKKPVDDWEDAETDRVGAHINAIAAVEELARFHAEPTSSAIDARLSTLEAMPAARDWQEFSDQAAAAIAVTHESLTVLRTAAVKREADAAELEALRAEKAARDLKDREEQDARDAAERTRLAEEDRKRRETEAEAAKKRAADAAVEAERLRVANAEAAEAEAAAKRERNKKHRTRVMALAAAAIKAAAELTDEQAVAVVKAIGLGVVPNVSIEF